MSIHSDSSDCHHDLSEVILCHIAIENERGSNHKRRGILDEMCSSRGQCTHGEDQKPSRGVEKTAEY